jgi:F-type H+-transporting ATPase subunit delta
MPNPSHPVARVYAAALIEIGRETNSLAAIDADLASVRRLYDGDAWFRRFFTSPRLERGVKWAAVRKAFEGKVGKPVLGLMKVLIEKGREVALDDVVTQFENLKDVAENRVHAYVTVAKPLAAELRAAVQGRLEKASGKAVAIHEKVDPAVLGGASIRIGDRIIDRTFRTRLAAMRKELLAR